MVKVSKISRRCGECRIVFMPRSNAQIYCSSDCKETNYLGRRRENSRRYRRNHPERVREFGRLQYRKDIERSRKYSRNKYAANRAHKLEQWAIKHPRFPQFCRYCDCEFMPKHKRDRSYCYSEVCKRKHIIEYNKKWRLDHLHDIRKQARQRAKQYYDSNPEKMRERTRQWTLDHPEQAKAARLRWRALNYSKAIEDARQYRIANREKINAYARNRYANNSEQIKEAARQRRHANPEHEREVQIRWRLANIEKIRERQRHEDAKRTAAVRVYKKLVGSTATVGSKNHKLVIRAIVRQLGDHHDLY